MVAWLSSSPMDMNTRKEEFSYAYIHAIASVAGFSVHIKGRSMDAAGIDLMIEVPGVLASKPRPKLELQVKCTDDESIVKETTVNFSLKVKNYNDLRYSEPIIPALLVVMLVPTDLEQWFEYFNVPTLLSGSNDEITILRKCAYWMSLKGSPKTSNKKITVHIPRQNLLTPESLIDLMTKAAKGEDL
ncbi:DUF4365 domain-containing protein [Pantanalinema rosaneae CENA516]|uniref:DUF4365 domain-containing protein n=1 Tax=Pantanalinema rosaneae TaxID=1620701 RepID=UPI003D6F0815